MLFKDDPRARFYQFPNPRVGKKREFFGIERQFRTGRIRDNRVKGKRCSVFVLKRMRAGWEK